MKHRCRILWQAGKEIRSFYWITIGSDESVYFGSLNAMKYKRGYHHTYDVPIDGRRINPMNDGSVLTIEEIQSKHSIHASGIFILPTKDANARMRHRIKPITEYSGSIPLVNILPMHVSQYPVISRSLREDDFVLNITDCQNIPFALTIYLRRQNGSEPPIMNELRKYPLHKEYEHEIMSGHKICAVLYSNPLTFINWRDFEYEVTSRSNEEGGEPVWVLFRDS